MALAQGPLEPGVLIGGSRHGASLPGTVGWYTTPMEMRPATREEFDDFDRAVLAAFHREVTEEDRRAFARTDEPERSLAWFDDGRIVAGTSIYSRHVTVPGAIVPCAAVTAVGVMPTHRRRGLLTAMMRRQLEDVRAARRAGRDRCGPPRARSTGASATASRRATRA